MKESFRTWLARHAYNWWPCYFGTGGRLRFISADYREVRLELGLGLRTVNYHWTIFGGSMYGCVDPIFALMLIKNLGKDYRVWDKAASIRYKRPGKSRLYAKFHLTEEDIQDIRQTLLTQKSLDRIYRVELKDGEGNVCAEIEKTVYIAKNDHFKVQSQGKLL